MYLKYGLYIPKYTYLVLKNDAIKRYVDTLEGAFELIKTYFMDAMFREFSAITIDSFLGFSNDENILKII